LKATRIIIKFSVCCPLGRSPKPPRNSASISQALTALYDSIVCQCMLIMINALVFVCLQHYSFCVFHYGLLVREYISDSIQLSLQNIKSTCRRSRLLWSGRSGDITMILQGAIEITCHDHSTTVWIGRFYILLPYLVFVFVVRFLFIRWFPCIRHSIIFWGFPHVMVHVMYHYKTNFYTKAVSKNKLFKIPRVASWPESINHLCNRNAWIRKGLWQL